MSAPKISAARLSDPAVEPVSLTELRDWLRVDASAEESLLTNLALAARLALESHTRRGFISQGWRFTILSIRCGGVLRPPLAPLRAVSTVRWYDAAGVAATLPPDAFSLDQDDQRPAMRLTTQVSAARFEIDATIGYGDAPSDVPAPLRQAILMLAANWHARRGDHPETELTIPRAITALVAPYRRARLA